MTIIEKRHRLEKEFYKGKISVAFTLCLKEQHPFFNHANVFKEFTDILVSIVPKYDCIVPVYCFMPDHQHLIITGTRDNSDVWKAIVNYKQKTGFFMARHGDKVKWQKDFYDHVIRSNADVVTHVKYILDNPVRKGLVLSWEDYAFKGAIGCRLEDVLVGIM